MTNIEPTPQSKSTDYVMKVFPVGWGHTNTHHAQCVPSARAINLPISSWEYRALPESEGRGNSSRTGPEGGLRLKTYKINRNFHSRGGSQEKCNFPFIIEMKIKWSNLSRNGNFSGGGVKVQNGNFLSFHIFYIHFFFFLFWRLASVPSGQGMLGLGRDM